MLQHLTADDHARPPLVCPSFMLVNDALRDLPRSPTSFNICAMYSASPAVVADVSSFLLSL